MLFDSLPATIGTAIALLIVARWVLRLRGLTHIIRALVLVLIGAALLVVFGILELTFNPGAAWHLVEEIINVIEVSDRV